MMVFTLAQRELRSLFLDVRVLYYQDKQVENKEDKD